ncbi:MAG: hypothetical protein Q8O37_01325 [Sulfuricellaceae bacterium]|nr:hypothetical protein [Sulfuricellaceae bacterium]
MKIISEINTCHRSRKSVASIAVAAMFLASGASVQAQESDANNRKFHL